MGASDIYAEYKPGPGLLSLSGRVLFCLIEDQDITRLALSLILGVSETAIDKSIANLQSENLLQVSRNGRKSRYVVNNENLAVHPDYRAIMAMRNDVKN